MECNVPTDIVFSFTGFALRGGKTGPHADGWGLALYEGKYARSFLEPTPACESAMADFIRDNPIKTLLAVAHVRKKTRGRRRLENTHPFKRTLWGRHWVFAHNGTLPLVRAQARRSSSPSARPTASTPSAGCSSSCAPPSPAATRARRGASGRDRRAGRRAGRRGQVQLPARRRAPPLRALRHEALLHRPQGAVRPRDARDAELQIDFSAFTTPSNTGRRRRDGAAHARRVWHQGTPGSRCGSSAAARCARRCRAAPPIAIRSGNGRAASRRRRRPRARPEERASLSPCPRPSSLSRRTAAGFSAGAFSEGRC